MKFIYTYWTKPIFCNNQTPKATSAPPMNGERTKLMLLHSIALLNNITDNIDILTDDNGISFLKENGILDKLKFNSIKNSLNEIDDYNVDLWGISKLYGLSLYDEPVCHIDFDFMIMNHKYFKNILLESVFDLIVQSKEGSSSYDELYKEASKSFFLIAHNKFNLYKEYKEFFYESCYRFVYNCGILGFKNLEAKEEYLNKAIPIFQKLNADPELINQFYNFNTLFSKKVGTRVGVLNINCVLEQYLLTIWSNFKNLYVKELMPMSRWNNIINSNSNQIYGNKNICEEYKHYLGDTKKYFF